MADVNQIVKVSQTYLDGNKPLSMALMKIKGIGFVFSNALCSALDIDSTRKVSTLSQQEIQAIEALLENPGAKLPVWILNRRRDYETGGNLHVTAVKLALNKEFDIKRLKQVKSYRGLRHAWGLPLRGQRTRSHFRHGRAVGVSKKAQKSVKKADSSKSAKKTEAKGKK